MRSLIIILLVSILGCGLVFSDKNTDNIEYNINQLQTAEVIIDTIISDAEMSVLGILYRFPYMKDYWDNFIQADTFLCKQNRKVPKLVMGNDVNSLVKSWKTSQDIFLKKVIVDKDERAKIIEENSLDTAYSIYHSNKNYQKLLIQILQSNLLINRFALTLHSSYKFSHTDLCFSYWDMLDKQIVVGKTSTLPIVHNNGCTAKFPYLRKIWINNQLVLEGFDRYDEFKLTYNGEKAHQVKVEYQNGRNQPILYKERVFDFITNTCDKTY